MFYIYMYIFNMDFTFIFNFEQIWNILIEKISKDEDSEICAILCVPTTVCTESVERRYGSFHAYVKDTIYVQYWKFWF